LGTEHLIDTIPSPNDSQEVALSIYTKNDLIRVAIEKEKEMSQSLLTCPRTNLLVHRICTIQNRANSQLEHSSSRVIPATKQTANYSQRFFHQLNSCEPLTNTQLFAQHPICGDAQVACSPLKGIHYVCIAINWRCAHKSCMEEKQFPTH